MNCILLSDVVTVLQQLLFLHVYTQVRIVIALAALTSVKKESKLKKRRRTYWILTLHLQRWETCCSVFSFEEVLSSPLRSCRDLAKASIGSVSFIFWYLLCLPLGLSETGFDHSWTSSVKKKCSSADQPWAPPVSCQFFTQVLSKD